MPGKSGYESVQRWRKVPLEKRGTRLGLRREEDLAPAAGTNLSACRDDYLEHLAVKNYRPMTINGRRQNLLYFLEWAHVRDLDQPGQITRKILEGYCRWLHHYRKKNGKPLSVKSQRDRIQVLKQFFSYLCKQDRLDANPASEIEIPRAERRLPRQPFRKWTRSSPCPTSPTRSGFGIGPSWRRSTRQVSGAAKPCAWKSAT